MAKFTKIFFIVLVLCSLLAACSSDSNESSKDKSGAIKAINTSFAEIENQDTFRFTGTTKISGELNGSQFSGELSINGITSFDGRNAKIEIDATDLVNNYSSIALPGKFVIEQLVIDGVVYMKTPDLTGQATYWIKQDVGSLIDQGLAVQNPTQLLQYLRGISDNVKELENESIDGKETSRYSAIISKEALTKSAENDEVQKYFENLGFSEQQLKEFVDNAKALAMDVDVWIDSDDLLRKSRVVVTAPASRSLGNNITTSGSEFKVEIVINYSDYGVELNLTPPPNSEVKTIEEMYSDLAL